MKMVLNLEMTKLNPNHERERQTVLQIHHLSYCLHCEFNIFKCCPYMYHEVLSHMAPGPMLVVFYLKTTKLLDKWRIKLCQLATWKSGNEKTGKQTI